MNIQDLDFKPHHLGDNYGTIATLDFPNGYGVSVLLGDKFYSNGVNTYEVAVTKDNQLCYDTDITDDVLGYQNESEVSDIMQRVAKLGEIKLCQIN